MQKPGRHGFVYGSDRRLRFGYFSKTVLVIDVAETFLLQHVNVYLHFPKNHIYFVGFGFRPVYFVIKQCLFVSYYYGPPPTLDFSMRMLIETYF